ncbi:TPA: hypothetical protein DCR79_01265 [Patescibacteria group bacterium]|nr:hypothetical protein [Patescibacteria group bacterium]
MQAVFNLSSKMLFIKLIPAPRLDFQRLSRLSRWIYTILDAPVYKILDEARMTMKGKHRQLARMTPDSSPWSPRVLSQ